MRIEVPAQIDHWRALPDLLGTLAISVDDMPIPSPLSAGVPTTSARACAQPGIDATERTRRWNRADLEWA